jgi:hypothetical protein
MPFGHSFTYSRHSSILLPVSSASMYSRKCSEYGESEALLKEKKLFLLRRLKAIRGFFVRGLFKYFAFFFGHTHARLTY